MSPASLLVMDIDALLATFREGTLPRDTVLALSTGELTSRNASGNTALHAAAKYGRLRDLPPAALTP